MRKKKHINNSHTIPYGKRSQIVYNYKEKYREYIIEINIYKIKNPISDPIGFKYSLVLIKNETRIVGFDNHENKGPHIHILNEEKPYNFVDEDTLLSDFYKEIRRFIQ